MKINRTMSISNILRNLCSIRQKIKIKNTFADIVYNFFSSEKVLQEHREICLEINGKKSLELKIGTIRFKNCFKQIAVPF